MHKYAKEYQLKQSTEIANFLEDWLSKNTKKNDISLTLKDLRELDKNLRPLRNRLAHKVPKTSSIVDAITAIQGTTLRETALKLFKIEYGVDALSFFNL